MSMSREMALFTLANTLEPLEAVLALEVLGEQGIRTLASSPRARVRVSLPGEWVKRQRLGVAETVYLIKNCTEEGALKEIAGRDKRAGVREALATHPVLEAEGEQNREKAEITLKRLLLNMGTTKGNKAVSVGVLEELLMCIKEPESAVNTAVLAMAKHGYDAGVVLYLSAKHNVAGTGTTVWSKGTCSAKDVIAAMNPHTRSRVAVLLYESGAGHEGPRFDADIATLYVECIRAPRTPKAYSSSQLFSSEGVDVLVQHPEWYTVLAGQDISDEQFLTLLEKTSVRKRVRLAWLVQRRRNRLVELRGALGAAKPILSAAEHRLLCACVNDVNDPLLKWIIARCCNDHVAGFLAGQWVGREGALIPTREMALNLVGRFGKDEQLSTRIYTIFNTSTPRRSFAAPEAPPVSVATCMLDILDGLAWMCRGIAQCGDYTFSRLRAAGGSLEQALEQFELMGAETSLDVICSVLDRLNYEQGERAGTC